MNATAAFTFALRNLSPRYIRSKKIKNRSYCPHCMTIAGKDEVFEEHTAQQYYNCNDDCNLELPPTGATMKFKNFTNSLERLFIV
jgi:hypothetical protein